MDDLLSFPLKFLTFLFSQLLVIVSYFYSPISSLFHLLSSSLSLLPVSQLL